MWKIKPMGILRNNKCVAASIVTITRDVLFTKYNVSVITHTMKQECIPVGYIPPTAVAVCWWGVCLSACWDTTRCGPGDTSPQVWAWRPPPPRCGSGDPPGQTPQLPPWVWAWRPPQARPLNPPPPGVSLEPARHAGIPPPPRPCPSYHLQCMLGYHSPPPPWTEWQTRVKR